MKCGEKIKLYREIIGLSQEELAKRTGYAGRSAISRIESGARDLSQEKIKVFAYVLGVSPVDLLDDRDDVSEDRQELLNLLQRLDEDQTQLLLSIVKQMLK